MADIIKGDGFTVKIVKSARRKTIALKVTHKGVSLHMPVKAPFETASHFVYQKTAWIKAKLKQQSLSQAPTRHFLGGEELHLLGEKYYLHLQQKEQSPFVHQSQQEIIVTGRINRLSPATIKKTLSAWYQQKAEVYLTAQTKALAKKTDLYPRSITVKSYKARWGSCKISGDIQFNWKLIQAPAAIIDYVIVHELCHLQHHNHSKQFWQLVAHHYPEFKQARQWLKEHGNQLEL
jgi:predicted metal-dependent hydrolase